METNERFLMVDSSYMTLSGGIYLCEWIPPRNGQYWVGRHDRGGDTFLVWASGDYTADGFGEGDVPCWTLKKRCDDPWHFDNLSNSVVIGMNLALTLEELHDVSPPVAAKTKIRLRYNWE